MSSVYAATYIVARPRDLARPPCPTKLAKRFADAVRREHWPYDVGDDPSFYAARKTGGAVTWGICRPDLRNALQVGDVVAFFGRRKLPDGNVDYCFSGYATVGGKVSQADIWPEDGSRCDYQRYLNLLVKRRGERFSHYEVHPGKPHPDWLWRVTCKDGHSWVKADFGTFEDPDCSKSFTPGTDVACSGEPIEFAPNYVVFAQGSPETFIIAEPPVVAHYHRGPMRRKNGRPTQWLPQ